MNIVACPATVEFGSLVAAMVVSVAASYCMGPSMARFGWRFFTSWVAWRTLSTASPLPDSPVE